jgi:hypothetical protein
MAELAGTDASLVVNPQAELSVVSGDVTEAYERGYTDFNFFAGIVAPEVMVALFPPFYIAIFRMLSTRSPEQIGRILRFALGLPRGHAKTTFVKILICWLFAYDKISFAVLVCANEELAQNLLSDIDDMLASSNAEKIYGKWSVNKSVDNKGMKVALYRGRSVILAALGAGSSVRGLNLKNRRPDIIFCDDAQTRECDESETERLKFRRWLTATLFKIVAPRGNRWIIYVGNMYSDTCILYLLTQNKSWVSFVTGAILEDGEPLWPELHSLEDLMESFFHDEELGEAESWFAEVMNDPISKALSLLTNELPTADDLENVEPDAAFITIDPAGFRQASDDNVIVVHRVVNGKGLIAKADAGIKDPEQLITAALRLAVEYNVSVIGVEDVGYQQTLAFWLEKYMIEWRLESIELVPLKPHNRSKETRIRQFILELYAGNYAVSKEVRAAFVWQAMKYKLGAKKNKDDLLDACAYGLDVRNEYWALLKSVKTNRQLLESVGVQNDNTPF